MTEGTWLYDRELKQYIYLYFELNDSNLKGGKLLKLCDCGHSGYPVDQQVEAQRATGSILLLAGLYVKRI